MCWKIQTLSKKLRKKEGGDEASTSVCAFALALRKFDFLLNNILTLWSVLVGFFISLLGQRYTMFRDYVFPFSIATYILHCLSATLASIARI